MSERSSRQHVGHHSGKALLLETVRRHAAEPDSERNILNLIPVPLWIDDFSDVKRRIDHFRHGGVANLREHLDNQPQEVFALLGMIRTLWVNNATLDLYEAADRTPFQGYLHRIFGEETYEVLKEQIVALADGRTEFKRKTVLTTPRGGQKDILLYVNVDPARAGDLSRVFVAIADITAVKAAEESLNRSETIYRRSFESAPIPMILVDARTRAVVDANRSLQQLLGAPPQAIPGAPIGTLCSESIDASRTKELASLIAGRQPMMENLHLYRGDGAKIKVTAAARTVQSGNQACTLLSFFPVGSTVLTWEQRASVDRRTPSATREELTERERQILTMITAGHTNLKIAEKLGISRRTVDTHRLRLMQKLDIHKATDLVRYALTSGLLKTT